MNEPIICTIVAKNYLAYARCLTESFLAHHPEGRVFVLLVDELNEGFDPAQERFSTVLASEIGIPDFAQMAFRYFVFELCTAVKPFFLEYLFRHYDCRKICYFDPDIYFYSRLDEIFELLDSYGIVLTPHLTGFLDDQFLPDELSILQSGAYNLGFIGLAEHSELDTFLHWWQRKLIKYSTEEKQKGWFFDQRWIDLAVSLFSSVYIHRDPGCNVAYWNLNHRPIERTESGYLVNGSPLKFFHFSGFSTHDVQGISKYQNRYTLKDLKHLEPLFYDYRDCLLANGHEEIHSLRCAYDYFDNGVYIPQFARYLWREVEDDGQRWPDPFKTDCEDSFLSWLNKSADNAPSHQPLITHLALEAYRRRADLQQAFRDVLGQDRQAFVECFISRARIDHGIGDIFIKPMADSLKKAREARKRKMIPKVPAILQRDWGKRFYLGATNLLMRTGVGSLIQRTLGDRFVSRVRNAFFPIGSSPARMPDTSTLLLSQPEVHKAQPHIGLNVVGYFRDETGVGEAARAILQALHRQGFPVAYTNVRSHTARKSDASVLHLPTGNPHNFNLLHVNADQVPAVYDELGPEFFAGKYNIGFWFWELASFPEQWLNRFNYFNEIWVSTSFAQTALAHTSPIPVVSVRVPVEKEPDPAITRQRLGLPEDRFLFLFVFDMLSVIERKNPLGLIEAYQRAFEPHFRDTTLVIKVTKLDEFSQYQKPLRQAVASVCGILLDGYLDRRALDGLFSVCDAYVSLHRSEGFGLTTAEAMCLGKPAIATAYSGNMDFMSVANSYPVKYRLVELEQDYGPYRKGEIWADPDIDHAAALMRRVFENPDEAAQKGVRAAADMRQLYGSEVVAQRIIQRLQYIARHRAAQGK